MNERERETNSSRPCQSPAPASMSVYAFLVDALPLFFLSLLYICLPGFLSEFFPVLLCAANKPQITRQDRSRRNQPISHTCRQHLTADLLVAHRSSFLPLPSFLLSLINLFICSPTKLCPSSKSSSCEGSIAQRQQRRKTQSVPARPATHSLTHSADSVTFSSTSIKLETTHARMHAQYNRKIKVRLHSRSRDSH